MNRASKKYQNISIKFIISQEKESGEEMLRKQKNETQKKAEELERVTSDLKKTSVEKSKLQENFDQIERHRDLLLDKVRRGEGGREGGREGGWEGGREGTHSKKEK